MLTKINAFRALWVCIAIAIALIGKIMWNQHAPLKQRKLTVLVESWPFSIDPLDYDAFIHHLTMTSIQSGLVTQYRLGEISGDLASSWDQSNNFKTWKFEIRPDRTFSNGERITPQIITQSLTRMTYLMKSMNSVSGVLDEIEGFHEVKSASDTPAGLSYDSHTVTFQLNRPDPSFLDKLSFGLYTIAHPNNFDPQTGQWKNQKEGITSGPYVIESWKDDEFDINLRKDFPKDQMAEYPISDIRFIRAHSSKDLDTADILFGSSDSLLQDSRFSFQGPSEQYIRYVICTGWQDSKSVVSNRDNRRILRSCFYKKASEKNLSIVRSFFPLSIKGVHSLNESAEDNCDLSKIMHSHKKPTLNFPDMKEALKAETNMDKLAYSDAFMSFADQINQQSGIRSTRIPIGKSVFDHRERFDLTINYTGILIENPNDDVRFMFLSKQGIRLPDETGEIIKEFKNDSLDLQKINQLMWDQALVWPVRHFSLGLWIKKDLGLSLDRLNTSLPPTDFRWISWQK